MNKTRLAVPALLMLALTACVPSEITSQPDAGGTSRAKAGSSTTKAAKVGDTITLKGNDDGLEIAVTVLKVTPSAKGKTEFNQPEKGYRFVAVQVRLKNVGSAVYDDSPGNGAKLIDNQDQQYDIDLNDVALGPSISASAKIAPGGVRKGYLVFAVPTKTKIAKLQFTLDSGFGPQSGEWLLK